MNLKNIAKFIKALIDAFRHKPEAPKEETPAVPGVDDSGYQWCYGGFDGSKAEYNPEVVLCDLKVNRHGLSYAYATGGCENLGAKSKTDYKHTLACLFCKVDGKWVGGKFDWISTSRLTRDFENIKNGYKGWDPEAIGKATEYAFMIVSSDGKSRSGIVTQARQ